jgi:4-hydroxy-2-oxoheptanedioate aldolase
MPEMSEMPRNPLKDALAQGRRQIGLWTSMRSPVSAEIVGHAGFDWILIDTEHAPNEVPDVLVQLQAMATGTAEPVVRCAWNDAVLIKRILDLGARSLLVPFVQNADEARQAVAAARYPPAGIRGVAVGTRATRWGLRPDYHRGANDEICLIVQIETQAALSQLEAIAAVDGVDALFIGPSDLAADMGFLGNPGGAEPQAAFKEAVSRIRAAGKPAGILSGDPAAVERYLEMGFTFVAVGSDTNLLAQAARQLAARFRESAAPA